MWGLTTAPAFGGVDEAVAVAVPMQSVDPSAVLELSAALRAPLAFVLVLVVGAPFALRWDSSLDRAIDATMDRPLLSAAYGVAAHLVIAFVGVYLASRLAGAVEAGGIAANVGYMVGVALFLAAAGIGFTVVGAMVADFVVGQYPWSGLVVGASIAGGIALAAPIYAAVAWVAVVSMGIGGSVRRWAHSSYGAGP
ncbi:MAG: hypothetical protein V5A23_01015 [Halobacteriales archaeon]